MYAPANYKKVYVDTRWSTLDGSPSRFYYELSDTLQTSEACQVTVTDVSIPVTWDTISEQNDSLYVVDDALNARIVKLAHGTYTLTTLAAEIQTAFNAQLIYTFVITTDTATGSIVINNTDRTFIIITDKVFEQPDFRSSWEANLTFDPLPTLVGPLGSQAARSTYKSANIVCGFSIPIPDFTAFYQGTMVDVRGYSNLYLCSENITNYKTLAPNGNRSVIRRIPVTVLRGDVIHLTSSAEDSVPCGNINVKTMQFSLRDVYMNLVEINSHFSFSLVFHE
jgi:hypothetical protein